MVLCLTPDAAGKRALHEIVDDCGLRAKWDKKKFKAGALPAGSTFAGVKTGRFRPTRVPAGPAE
jgi:hypothetical protein